MSKSRKRGGEKEHRKRLKKRLQMIQQKRVEYTKLFNERLKESLEKQNENTNNIGISEPIRFKEKD